MVSNLTQPPKSGILLINPERPRGPDQDPAKFCQHANPYSNPISQLQPNRGPYPARDRQRRASYFRLDQQNPRPLRALAGRGGTKAEYHYAVDLSGPSPGQTPEHAVDPTARRSVRL